MRGVVAMRVVMCVGTFPEDNYEDFEVFAVLKDETDEQAISRAEKEYSPENEFYVEEKV